jgi:predicted RNase H-like HicB family nuclease
VAAGTLGEVDATCWAEVLATESAAFENLDVALENWVAASEMDDADPALVGESSAVL